LSLQTPDELKTALRNAAKATEAKPHYFAPLITRAIIEIEAVVKNLTAEPTTLRRVSDLQRWLGTDEVVEDVCDLVEGNRTPFYGALEDLRSLLAA
jgi:hypothetical protein